jgi:hypothetical protein
VRRPRFKLWTMLVVVAILATLMGLAATRRIDRRSNIIEMNDIYNSDRTMGLTESWRVWIKVHHVLPIELINFVVPPSVIYDHGQTRTVFYRIPVECLAALIVALATMMAMFLDYLCPRKRQRRFAEISSGTPQRGTSNHRRSAPGPKRGECGSVG